MLMGVGQGFEGEQGQQFFVGFFAFAFEVVAADLVDRLEEL